MNVPYAKMGANQQVFHPKMGARLEGTLIDNRYKGIKMRLTGNGVRIDYKGASVLVPLHMFDFVEIEDNGKEAPKADK